MARYWSADSNRVSCGSGAGLDSLSVFTYWAWIALWPGGADRGIFGKGTFAGANRRNLSTGQTHIGSGYRLSGSVDSSTTRASSNSRNVIPFYEWSFVVMNYDDTTNKIIRLFVGNEIQLVEECGYSSVTAGIGTIGNNDADTQWIGNLGVGNVFGLRGLIGPCGIVTRIITIAEMCGIQQNYLHPITGTQLLVNLGANGSEIDLSGNGHTITPSGTTIANYGPNPRIVRKYRWVDVPAQISGNTWPGYQSASGWY